MAVFNIGGIAGNVGRLCRRRCVLSTTSGITVVAPDKKKKLSLVIAAAWLWPYLLMPLLMLSNLPLQCSAVW